jgi:voltage-gated potassium channel
MSRNIMKHHHPRRYFINIRLFLRRVFQLFSQPIFISLTIFGNFVILSATTILYWLEAGVNPAIKSPLDTLWWAMATVTTVGYGDVTPITTAGRLVGIIMMVVGTALFWSYTALFANAVISKEIIDIEMELHDIQKRLSQIDHTGLNEKTEITNIISALHKEISRLHKSRR